MNSDVVSFTERRMAFLPYNLNYESLDSSLNAVRKNLGRTPMRRASSTQSLIGETRTFAEILDHEVEKVVLFYIREQGTIAAKAWELREKQLRHLQDFTITLDDIESLCQSYRELGGSVLNLLDYLEHNVLNLRKIIRKHDSVYDVKLGSIYFDTRLGKSSKNAQLLPLYHQEGIQAIMSTIRRGFEDLYDARTALLNPNDSLRFQSISSPRRFSITSPERGSIPRVPFQTRRLLSAGNLLDVERPRGSSSSSSSSLASGGMSGGGLGGGMATAARTRSTGSLFGLLDSSRANSSQMRGRSTSDLEPILAEISTVARRVMQTQKKTTVEFLASTSKMALEMSLDDLRQSDSNDSLYDLLDDKESASSQGVGKETDKEAWVSPDGSPKRRGKSSRDARSWSSMVGLYINLFITFTYLANQYVVAPTSGEYAALLGMTPAMAGIIIGMTPAAALVSSLFYSMWSNWSFTQPMITCVLCGIVGNLLYGMALQCNAPYMIIMGRLITGFGGPRVISRRYIADHVPASHRLVASSQFVTAGALGLSMGPLISSLVQRSGIDVTWKLTRSITLVHYTTVTAPGWIMCAFWIVALVAIIFFFVEPDQKYMRGHRIKSVITVSDDLNMKTEVGNLSMYGKQHDEKLTYVPITSEMGPKSLHPTINSSLPSFSAVQSRSALGGSAKQQRSKPAISSTLPRGVSLDATSSSFASMSDDKKNVVFVEPGLDALDPNKTGENISPVSETFNTWNSLDTKASENESNSRGLPEHVTLEEEEEEDVDERPSETKGMVRSSHKDDFTALNTSTSTNIQPPAAESAAEDTPLLTRQSSEDRREQQMQLVSLSYDANEVLLRDPNGAIVGGAADSISGGGGGGGGGIANYGSASSSSVEVSPGRKTVPYALYPQQQATMLDATPEPYWTEYITSEVLVILFIYFVNKMGQELCVSSIPVITASVFGWSQESSGYYMTVVGALVLPVTIFLNQFIRDVEERDVVLWLTYACMGSLLFICHTYILGEYTLMQYVLGSAILFTALNSMEGIIMALLAKLISPELAKGTFNSGLLATEAGTLGRVVGDMAITGFGVAKIPTMLVNNLFLPYGLIIFLSLLLVLYYFDRLT